MVALTAAMTKEMEFFLQPGAGEVPHQTNLQELFTCHDVGSNHPQTRTKENVPRRKNLFSLAAGHCHILFGSLLPSSPGTPEASCPRL